MPNRDKNGSGRTESKREERLTSEQVQKWVSTLKGQSKDEYLKRFYGFMDTMREKYPDLTPEGLLSMKDRESDNQALYDLLTEYVTIEEDAGRISRSTIYDRIKAVKSFLKQRGSIVFINRIDVEDAGLTTTLEDEVIPDAEIVRKLIMDGEEKTKKDGSTKITDHWKDRISASFMAWSGLRAEALGWHDGSKGLEIKDLIGLRIENGEVFFDRMPLLVHVRPEIDKARGRQRRGYHTIYPSQGCILLKTYLEQRMREGEVLGPDSPIRPIRRGGEIKHCTTKSVRLGISRLMKNVHGINQRPYVLRRYFITALGNITTSTKIIQYFSGHALNRSNDYMIGKGQIEKQLDDMWKVVRDKEDIIQGKSSIPKPDIEQQLSEIREENKQLKEQIDRMNHEADVKFVEAMKTEGLLRKSLAELQDIVIEIQREKKSR